jgi:hypothetical protein
MWALIVRAVAARMLAIEGLRQRPDCPKKPLPRPIVITGLPRCGTTALHKLMSVDPQFQGLAHWLAEFPIPRPPHDEWPAHPYYQAMVRSLTSRFDERPDLKSIHFEAAEEVDECFLVLQQSFVYNTFGESLQIPMYDEWWMAQDETRTAYPWYAKVMRLIGADDARTWLLKNPGHMWCMEGLFDTYDDPLVIQMHRRIDLAYPSFFSLIREVRGFTEGSDVDLPAIARRDLKVWSEGARRILKYRERHPEPFLDIYHEEFNADPIGTVRAIYTRFGITLSPDVEAAMRARIADDPERRHGRHRYNLDMFGLDRKTLENSNVEYLHKYPRLAPV